MKSKITLFAALASFLFAGSNVIAQTYHCVQNNSGEAHIVAFDISTGTLIDSVGVQFTNVANAGIEGFSGMCQDPVSGDVYVIAHEDVSSNRHLGTIDLFTGDVTSVGILNMTSASMCFDGAGTLYINEGQGSANLYTVSTTDATETLFHTWATSDNDGEALAVNTTDGLLYRYGGGSDGVFMSLDLTTLTETTITTLSGVDTWGGALYYDADNNDFTFASGEFFYNLTTGGTLTTLSDITALNWNGNFKGIHKCMPELGVTLNGTTITADAAGQTYQWIDCATDQPIMGETNQSYTPTVTGDYAVIVDNGICADTSACTLVDFTSLNELNNSLVNVYPNPSTGKINIDVEGEFELEVMSISGRVIETYNNVQSISIETPGTYLLRFNDGANTITKKVIIK